MATAKMAKVKAVKGAKGTKVDGNDVNVSKVDDKLNNYISYFQSVTTIGIVSRAKNSKEAELKSKKKFCDSELSCGIVSQTPFQLSETEQWSPNFTGLL